jgi:N-formylglutamate amidohydrolase
MHTEDPPIWCGSEGETPIVAVAVHAGHALRPEIEAMTALDEETRFREEDPYTDRLAEVSATRLVAGRSRFEVDLNRPRESAVYAGPDEAWGLDVWQRPPAPETIARSQAAYDAFYVTLETVLTRAEQRFGRFVLYDIHSYNHRREGHDQPPADPDTNPDINVGTGSMDRSRWGHVVDRFMDAIREVDVDGRRLEVAENVRFKGGHLSEWVHSRFRDTGCALAIEVKKFFMDEHTGSLDDDTLDAVGEALRATTGPVEAALR